MVDRADIGSWLTGPPGSESDDYHKGRDLGLPDTGPGSIARFPRRVVALFVDGFTSQLIAAGLLGYRPGAHDLTAFGPSAVFLLLHFVMIATGGYTIGHRLLGLRVVRTDGGWAGPVPALIRTVAFALIVPLFIVDRDDRGLHDRLAGTMLVRA